ncbi:potassium channel family protein [Sedimentimonas flavescens]|uniref:Potassium channel family protein n=1 Tax=Sedimentimonas flavescens TaxID=2851012 RepID=A0ABT3A031_9RHOB|nr:potassium channel family protein [Sedimentimonas flavescens]MBW0157603.1 potassium channel family protein [Sedimentimonas flavescens]MCV2879325.1 potassium channel family protein [Sedimentimonas flavescens]WBL32079.1 potassium channel family protein [Sinirhodobacter sp. HNIBRBA609]
MLSFLLNILRLFKAIIRSWRIPTFRATLSLAGILLLTGTVFYHQTEGWSWIDSLYFSTTTMSTVGFGDLTPQTNVGKLFTVVYIFVGVGVFVALFTQLARALLKIEEPADSPTAKEPAKD